MSNNFKILPLEKAEESLIFSSQQVMDLSIDTSKKTLLSYGTVSYPVNISTSQTVGMAEIALSTDIIDRLRIPLSSHYEIIQHQQGIRIGPYIGFLLTQSAREFDKYLPHLSPYLGHYQHIGGTILAFCLENVKRNREVIKGVVYNPQTKKWEKGIYGYPSSFFIKSRMIPRDYLSHFEKVLGKAIFNDFNFNKWEMHQLLYTGGLKAYLPPCQLYEYPAQIKSFLREFGKVYIKPVYGSRGESVFKVRREQKGFSVHYRDKNKNKRLYFSRMNKMLYFFEIVLKPRMYIMQKAIQLVSVQNRIIDFRTIMVKNDRREWKKLALIARHGAPYSVVSNISAGGYATRGAETLATSLKLSVNELNTLREQISEIAFAVGNCLDQAGVNCGNMGVDLGVDINRQIWILEIQHNNPDPTLALDAGETSVFSTILLNNLYYLKGLAGFGRKSHKEGAWP